MTDHRFERLLGTGDSDPGCDAALTGGSSMWMPCFGETTSSSSMPGYWRISGIASPAEKTLMGFWQPSGK